ncbi:hypothetical protein SELMODRAFT_91653 [Selaginella moellendorffii]|uniref:non-specific serine/threonine protein kinase n=1 Tax=Selaginella moellendorffii TaxID=88036 RepID=D8REF0_SELML|nr:hypothetical protein SELMODRAFT_91653 [Selaginella moellendorffii]
MDGRIVPLETLDPSSFAVSWWKRYEVRSFQVSSERATPPCVCFLAACPFNLTALDFTRVASACSDRSENFARIPSCCKRIDALVGIAAAQHANSSGDLCLSKPAASLCLSSLVAALDSNGVHPQASRACGVPMSLRGQCQCKAAARVRDIVGAPGFEGVVASCESFGGGEMNSSRCSRCSAAATRLAASIAAPNPPRSCQEAVFVALASFEDFKSAMHKASCLFQLQPPKKLTGKFLSPRTRPEDDVSMSLLPDPINKLAHQSPSPVTIVLAIGIGITGATVAILLVLVLLLQRKREESVPLWNKDSALDVWQGSGNKKALRALRRFKYSEIEKATNHFHSLIGQGRGAASAVYRAKFKDGLVAAVKRFHAAPQPQSEEEFKNEAHFLGRLHHRHLVSLRGFCMRKNERFLVYDFMENGSLKERLHLHHRRSNGTLSWQRRLQIAIEVATGMEYVHCYCEPPLCHGNLKSSNILLDENFVAKVSKDGDTVFLFLVFFISTSSSRPVPYSGYVDPEFSHTGVLTEKSDVYSFGVLLLELVSSRPVTTAGDKHILDWAHEFYNFSDARLVEMVDSTLRDQIDPDELKKIITVSRLCSQSEAASRPSMKQVVNLLLDNAIAIFPPLSFSATIKDDDGDGDGDGKQHRRVNSDDSLSIHSATGIPSFSTATSNAKNLFLFSTSPHAPSFSSYSTYSPSYSLRFS